MRLFFTGAVVVLSACGPLRSPLRVSAFAPPDSACTSGAAEPSSSLDRGDLDVLVGSPAYMAQVFISNVDALQEGGSEGIGPLTKLDRVRLSYVASAPLELSAQSFDINFPLPRSGASTSITLNLLTRATSRALEEWSFDEGPVTLTVQLDFEGAFTGNGVRFTVDRAQFPITVVRGTPMTECAKGYSRSAAPGSCIYAGQLVPPVQQCQQ